MLINIFYNLFFVKSCKRTDGSHLCTYCRFLHLINACTFAPCSANPYGADTRLTQNAVLPVLWSSKCNHKISWTNSTYIIFYTDKLKLHLLTTFNSSSSSVILFVTASNFSAGNPVLCFSIRFVIKLKSAGLPLNISVASIAIFFVQHLFQLIFL